jgi:hypothetical protein
MNLVVCDAGGSTVDTTCYKVAAVDPMLELKEIKASACKIVGWAKRAVGRLIYFAGIQAGSIFIDDAVKLYLCRRLESAGLDEEDIETYMKEGIDQFINFVKPKFDDTEEILNIKVGKRKLNVESINIQGGRMKLAG